MRAIIILFALATTLNGAYSETPSAVDDELSRQHDVNGNGKIDVDEHKDFARQRARQRLAEVRELAKHRPKLTAQERMFYKPPRVTPDFLKGYDVNHNGKLDLDEKVKLQNDAGNSAKLEFKQHDKNGDGKLDAEERKGVKARIHSRPSSQASDASPAAASSH